MNIALIFAGGVGSRMGSETPKQFLEVNGKSVIIHTLEVFEKQKNIDGMVIACKEEWISYTWDLIEKAGLKKVASIVPGGETALDSQYNGLLEIQRQYGDDNVAVLIHDGVRPLIDGETIQKCIESAHKYGNAITVARAIETVIKVNDQEEITNIIDRDSCRMAKAPQCFMLSDILKVHKQAICDGKHDFIDSASMMMDYGYKLHAVMGNPENIKITTPSDYYMFLGICESERKGQNA